MKLSPREEEVAALIGEGLNPSAVCKALRISISTYSNHVNKINLKWRTRNRTQIAVRAWKIGLVR